MRSSTLLSCAARYALAATIAGAPIALAIGGCSHSERDDCFDTCELENDCDSAAKRDCARYCDAESAVSKTGKCDDRAKDAYDCVLEHPNLCDGSVDMDCKDTTKKFSDCLGTQCAAAPGDANCAILAGG